MAEHDQSSKTEEPTAKKLKDAFIEGQFAQSAEIQVTFGLAAAFLTFLFAGQGVVEQMASLSVGILGNLETFDLTETSVASAGREGIVLIGRMLLPLLGAALLAAIIAGGLQTGFRLTPKVLEIKWTRLNPVTGFSRVISKDVLIRFGIDLLKLCAVGGILVVAIRRVLLDPIFFAPVDVWHVGTFVAETTLFVLVRLILAAGIIAAISYAYQWRKTHKELMMTREEVKQERKTAEVDPHLRNAQRQMGRRLMQRQMLSAIPTADVVVTNPTHYAIALKYERGVDKAPVVLARGENSFAMRIKEIARKHEVPMVENRPVARMLYKYGRVGQEIPMQLYQAVAEILGFVYKTHRYYFHRLKSRRLGSLA
jgi:flagellar biosynthesis protein FlhB